MRWTVRQKAGTDADEVQTTEPATSSQLAVVGALAAVGLAPAEVTGGCPARC